METKHAGFGWTYYTWDVDEALTDIIAGDIDLGNAYDADMKRLSRDEDGTATDFLFDGEKLLRVSRPALIVTTAAPQAARCIQTPGTCPSRELAAPGAATPRPRSQRQCARWSL